MIKTTIRKAIPEPLLAKYHLSLAKLAASLYAHPSEKMIVIGVTGTNGKSTTVQFIGKMLEAMGEKVGWTSTAGFSIAGKETINDKKMTMLGRFQTHKILKQMVKAGCKYAIVETSSQGIIQSRHIGINYDIAVFTNLTPEHIEAHGGFENYMKAKGELFAHTKRGNKKLFGGEYLDKAAIVNQDDEHAHYFQSFKLDRQVTYGLKKGADTVPTDIKFTSQGTTFSLFGAKFDFKPIGKFNLYNLIAAITTVNLIKNDPVAIKKAVATLESVPGRLEMIDKGQPFSVVVDYAYEPAALNAVYEALDLLNHNRIIHITGSAGGGRDVARRKIIGELAAKKDDVIIVANEDPYDEDPMQIINDVADAAKEAGKTDDKDLFRILDRGEAIDKAIEMAGPGDLVLITGKGSEPVMAVAGGKKAKWDDRDAARLALEKAGYKNGSK